MKNVQQDFKTLLAHLSDLTACKAEQNEFLWQKKKVLTAFLDGYAARKRDRTSKTTKGDEAKTTTTTVKVADKAKKDDLTSPIVVRCCLACLWVKQFPLEALLFAGKGGTSFSRHKCVDQIPAELYAFNCADPCDSRYVDIEFEFKHDHPVDEGDYRVELEFSAVSKRYYVKGLSSYVLEDGESNIYDEIVEKVVKGDIEPKK